jgi:DNA-binding transcriptional LysR family regulator
MINWDDLRFLLEVARTGSMSGAARVLKVNHATVIRRIRSLEEQLGSSLFDRVGHAYVITPAGAAAFEAAERMEAESVHVERQVLGQARDLTGVIRVTAPEPMSETILVPMVREFNELYPDILIDLSLSMRVYDLGMREADVAFRVTKNPPEELVGTVLTRLHMAVYAPAGANMCVAEIDKVISMSGGEPTDYDWKDEYAPAAKISLQTDSASTALHAIRGGLGVARLPLAIGDPDETVERVLDIPVQPGHDLWMLTHVDVRTNARLRAFRDFVQVFYEDRKHLMEGELAAEAGAA